MLGCVQLLGYGCVYTAVCMHMAFAHMLGDVFPLVCTTFVWGSGGRSPAGCDPQTVHAIFSGVLLCAVARNLGSSSQESSDGKGTKASIRC